MPASYGRWDAAERRQGALRLVHALAARLALKAQPLQARDLSFAFAARRVPGREGGDQLPNARAQLQREVRRRGAHQLAHVLHRHLMTWPRADRMLCLAHFLGKGNDVVGVVEVGDVDDVEVEVVVVVDVTPLGAISNSPSSSACVLALMALSSPISQPWL
jgi:hypothetical protein